MNRKRLWDCTHSYYCETSQHTVYNSWSEFLDEEDSLDPDLNLVFRFDWVSEDDSDDCHNVLKIYYYCQRLGKSRTVSIMIGDSEIDAVEQAAYLWLEKRFKHIKSLWAPYE